MNESEDTVALSTYERGTEKTISAGSRDIEQRRVETTHSHSRPLLVLLRDGSKELQHSLSSLGLRSNDVSVDGEETLL